MNTPEQQLSESLLAACKAAGIESPRYIAQDKDGTVWHYDGEPDTTYTSDFGIFAFDPDIGEHAISLNHPSYADDWRESLLEWVEPQEMLPTVFIPHEGEPLVDVLARHPEHVADASKMIDDACEIAYHKHIENGNGFRWSRLDCYRAAWEDALAWKGGSHD
jgi:hypothetical protein